MVALAYQPDEFWTLEEYADIERNSRVRHEYIHGHIVAMAGASTRHNRIVGNIFGQFYNQLRGGSCEPFMQDLRTRMPERNYVYPDVVVGCEPLEWDEKMSDTLANPVVVIEVLSPSTQARDRGEKFDLYRQLPSLRDYIMVSQERRCIEHYQRRDSGDWLYRVVEADSDDTDATVVIDSINCRLALADVYERVEFAAPQRNTESESTTNGTNAHQ